MEISHETFVLGKEVPKDSFHIDSTSKNLKVRIILWGQFSIENRALFPGSWWEQAVLWILPSRETLALSGKKWIVQGNLLSFKRTKHSCLQHPRDCWALCCATWDLWRSNFCMILYLCSMSILILFLYHKKIMSWV